MNISKVLKIISYLLAIFKKKTFLLNENVAAPMMKKKNEQKKYWSI